MEKSFKKITESSIDKDMRKIQTRLKKSNMYDKSSRGT